MESLAVSGGYADFTIPFWVVWLVVLWTLGAIVVSLIIVGFLIHRLSKH